MFVFIEAAENLKREQNKTHYDEIQALKGNINTGFVFFFIENITIQSEYFSAVL